MTKTRNRYWLMTPRLHSGATHKLAFQPNAPQPGEFPNHSGCVGPLSARAARYAIDKTTWGPLEFRNITHLEQLARRAERSELISQRL